MSSRLKIRSRELSTSLSSLNSNIITKKGEFLPLLVLNLGFFFFRDGDSFKGGMSDFQNNRNVENAIEAMADGLGLVECAQS